VDGDGSKLTVSNEFGHFPGYGGAYLGEAAKMFVGRLDGSYGYLGVTNGGTVDVINDPAPAYGEVGYGYDNPVLRFGRENGAQGVAVIDGLGSSLNIVQTGPQGEYYDGGARLLIGVGGYGKVTVSNDAQVNVLGDDARLYVARGRGGDNTTDQSHLYIQGGADVLVDSQGYGGEYNGASLIIGSGPKTNGAVTLDGLGSTLTVTTSSDVAGDYQSAEIIVGGLGYGRLDVTNYGAIYARALEAGSQSYGLYAGYGIVNINTGGTVTITGTDYTPYRGVRIGQASGTTGIVNVDGAGSTLTSQGGSGLIRVGANGTGELNLTEGGQVNGFFVDVGRNFGSDGRITVDGAGSKLTVSDAYGSWPNYYGEAAFLRAGRNFGSYGKISATNGGEIEVTNGATVNDFLGIQIARNYGSTGVLEISGAGSQVNVILNGPSDDAYSPGTFYGAYVAAGRGGHGTATVDDGGALNITGDAAKLEIGRHSGSDGILSIVSGGTVTVDSQHYGGNGNGASVVIGRDQGADGAVTVDGLGSTLTVTTTSDVPGDYQSALITVGHLGYGRLDVTNYGAVSARELEVGRETYGLDSGYGIVNINSGGTVTVTGTDYTPWRGIHIAGMPGTIGIVNVDGAGSTLTSEGGVGYIKVGGGGTGELNITNGGRVNAFDLNAGRTDGSDGRVTVDGAGSRLVVSDAYGHFTDDAGEAAFMHLGTKAGSYGYLSVTNGGQVDVINDPAYGYDSPVFKLGRENGSTGVAVVDGVGSSLNIVQTGPLGDYYGTEGAKADIGDGGYGKLDVRDNAQVNVIGAGATLSVADGRGGNNTLQQSLLSITGGADVLVDSQGYGGFVSLPDGYGGYIDAFTGARVVVGDDAQTNGRILVDGLGSTLTVTTSTDLVGDYQSAELIVGNLGYGRLDVTNYGTVSARELEVGSQSYGPYSGYGIVNINSGGTVTITGTDNTAYRGVQIGLGAGTTGIVNVDGEGSTLTSEDGSGRIRVANHGTGQLNVTGGGQVNAFFVDVGRNNGSDGRITVDGIGSNLTVSDEFGHFPYYVPGYGQIYLGEAGFMRFGREAGSYGYLGITNGGTVEVITDPGSGYDEPFIQLGRNNGSTGVAVIDGEGSSLNVAQTGPVGDYYGTFGAWVAVGDAGYGRMEVRNNAQLNVLGARAYLTVADGRRDGYGNPDNTAQQSLLSITGGADVLVDSQGYGGFQSLPDGYGGYADVFIGATVVVGNDAQTNGRIVVDGAGSTLTVTSSALPPHATAGELLIGELGSGVLKILNGGQVVNSAHNGTTQIAAKPGSTGLVIVDGATSLLDAGEVLAIGADVDAMTLDVLPDAGGDGTLTLVDDGHVMADDVYVGSIGAITGDGIITGDVTLLGGTLSPGASYGALSITGNLNADQNASLFFEMGGSAAGQFDTITVTGEAVVDLRAIDVVLPDGGGVAAGTTATVMSAGSLTITNFDNDTLLTEIFGSVPVEEGESTLQGANQAFLFAETGSDLIVQALGPDGTNETGAVDFGASETDSVDLTTVNGFGTGTGGGFDAFALFGVTAVSGTAGDDTIVMTTTSSVSIDGRGGDDTLTGGSGDDNLMGGDGKNLLFGSNGADTFILSDDAVFDTIGDFVIGDDLIDVSDWSVTVFEDLTITEKGNGTINIHTATNSVRLLDEDDSLEASALTADSFIFAVA
jgi:autotransporter family porin